MLRRFSFVLSFALLFAAGGCGDDTSEVFGSGGGSASSAATGQSTTAGPGVTATASGPTSTSDASSSSSSGAGGEGGAGVGGSGGQGVGTGGAGSGGDSGAGGETGAGGSGGTGGAGAGGDGAGGNGVCVDPEFEPDDEVANTEVFTLYRGTATGALEDVLNVTVLASGTGDFEIQDVNFDSCTTCVLLRVQCEQGSTDCAQKFLADAGTVRIETVGDELVGELIDVHLYEVTVDEDGTSTPVADGETRCIESYEIDTPTTPI